MKVSDDDRINDRVDNDDIVKEKKKTHLNIYVLLGHLYFSTTDDAWHIALRLVVHTEAVGVPQSTCAISYLNDSERSGNTQHMKTIVQSRYV